MDDAIAFIEVLFGIPFIIGVGVWIIQVLFNPTSPQVIEKGGQLIAQAAIPWWVTVLQFLTSLPGIGAILAALFIIYLATHGTN